MPAFGLGVFLSPKAQTADAVVTAVAHGYRLIDTAAAYNNERQVGEGVRRSGVDRSELFVTTKLWMTDYGHDRALRAFDASMARLGLDYLDLYLLHWPMPGDFDATAASFTAAAELLAEGRVRAIGVCNHSPRHLAALIERTGVVPAVNQVELHPYFIQEAVREADAAHGVVTQSWSPIGGVHERNRGDGPGAPAPAARRPGAHRSGGQVRQDAGAGGAALAHRARPLPHPQVGAGARIAENIDIFDFALAPEDVAAIDALDTGRR